MSIKLLDNFTVICSRFDFRKGQRCHFPDSSVLSLLTRTHLFYPLIIQSPLFPPPLDVLSYYEACFGSLLCVHVMPLCERPRLKLCGKSLASLLNTLGTVQGLGREGTEGRGIGKDRKVLKRRKIPLNGSKGGPWNRWNGWMLEGKVFELLLYVGHREGRDTGSKRWEKTKWSKMKGGGVEENTQNQIIQKEKDAH